MTDVMEIAKKIKELMETDPREAMRLTTEVLPTVVRDGSAPVVIDVRIRYGQMSDYECDMWGDTPERYFDVFVGGEWRFLGAINMYKANKPKTRERLHGLTFEAAQKALYA